MPELSHAAPGEVFTVALARGAAGVAEEDGRLGMVREVLGRMPEVQREVLELRVKCGLSYAEVAGVLGIPLGTVRSRIHAAVAALRERVIEEEGR